MAKDNDNGMNYKEGVDYEMIDKGGYKTRRFFTKAEKDAMKMPKPKAKPASLKAPKAPAPKAPAPKTKVPFMSATPARPSLAPAGMPAKKFVQTGTSRSGGLRTTPPTNLPTTPRAPITGTSRSGGLRTTTPTNKSSAPMSSAGGDMPRVDAMGNAYRKGGMVSKPKAMASAMKKYEKSAKDMKEDRADAKKMLPPFMRGKK